MEVKIVKSEESKEDLGWQKPAESDNLNKSESPNTDYMKEKGLCSQCHGLLKSDHVCPKQ